MSEPESNNASLDLVGIAERLRSCILTEELDGTEFAKRAQVPYSTMRSYLGAGRPPSPEFLVAVYRVYGILPSWILTGEGDRKANAEARVGAASDLVLVPLLAAQASGGNGLVNEPVPPYAMSGLAFSRDWLAKRGLNGKSLAVITVKGNSMDGVLSTGDHLLINQQDTQVRSGFIYVLRQRDELLVKFCQILPNGLLRVSSSNQNYAPYDVDLSKSADVEIIGRVVASTHEW